MKVFRVGHLTVNARHWIMTESHRRNVNGDRIPAGMIRVSVYPGEDHFLSGDDADEFLRQIDEMFPKHPRPPDGPREITAGQPHEPDTGEEELPDSGSKERG